MHNFSIAKNIISNRVNQVPQSKLSRFFGIASSMPDVISLAVGEPDFATPVPLAEAGFESVKRGQTGYTANAGLIELREAISFHLEHLYKIRFDPQNEMIVTVGTSEALSCIFTAICDPDDEIIVPQPSFVSYIPEIIFSGGKPVVVSCQESNNFEITAAEIEEKITPKTKAIFLNFPNNPTGAVLSYETVLEITHLAEKHNLLIISDEIYDRLTYGVEHICFSTLPGMKDRTILLGGFSKNYAMTGWRVGYICANADLMAAFSKIHQYRVMSAPTISQYTALAALKIGEPFVLEMKAEYEHRRKLVLSSLAEMGLPCVEPKGGFFAFPSVKNTGMNAEQFAEKLLLTEQVAVVPGTAFGTEGENNIRIAYCKSFEQIVIAMERMHKFICASKSYAIGK